MIPLALNVAVLDELTRGTCLETNVPSCLAATIGTADDNLIILEIETGIGAASLHELVQPIYLSPLQQVAMRPWLQMMMPLSSWPSGSAFIDVAYSIPSARRFTLPLTTSKDNNDTGLFLIKIRDAKFSDLSEVARMVSDGFFHDEGQNNPIMRWIRPIMELGRLQTSFTYEMEVDGGSVVDRHYFLVAHDGEDNKVVGFCDVDGRGGYGVAKASLLPWVKRGKVVRRPQPYISDLVVSPDLRRCGVASRLLDEAERRAQDWGFEEMFLCIRRTNNGALQMYSKRGYITVEPSDKDMLDFLEAQEDLIMLRRLLG